MNVELLSQALTAIAGAAALASAGNLFRSPREPDILEPNCLLTRYPIEFWTGPRSFFYFHAYWGDLPVNLAAHGHQVRVVRLPWLNRTRRRRWVESLPPSPKHLILDPATAAEFADYLGEYPPLSVTIIDPPLRTALDRICFHGHRAFAALIGLKIKAPQRLADPCKTMRSLVRDLAEEDWISS